jgi:hypothetical protein
MEARLYRVPIKNSPFNAAIYVAACCSFEAFNIASRFGTAAPDIAGIAEVQGIMVSELEGEGKDYQHLEVQRFHHLGEQRNVT